MALFSKQNKEAFIKPLNGDNPVLVQVLGICSALAVTSQLKPAIVMGLAVTIITAFSNVIIPSSATPSLSASVSSSSWW